MQPSNVRRSRASLAGADETEQLRAELTDAHGVSGFDGSVRDILRREWKDVLTERLTAREVAALRAF